GSLRCVVGRWITVRAFSLCQRDLEDGFSLRSEHAAELLHRCKVVKHVLQDMRANDYVVKIARLLDFPDVDLLVGLAGHQVPSVVDASNAFDPRANPSLRRDVENRTLRRDSSLEVDPYEPVPLQRLAL